MHAVIRGLIVYAVLLVIFRLSGKRTLAQATPFDLVLTLIISEAIQQAMIDNDNSLTHALLIVTTLVATDIVLSLTKQKWPRMAAILDGCELLIVHSGKPNRDYMNRERIDDEELLQSARAAFGLKNLDEIDYAVLEQSGQITVVPKKQ